MHCSHVRREPEFWRRRLVELMPGDGQREHRSWAGQTQAGILTPWLTGLVTSGRL